MNDITIFNHLGNDIRKHGMYTTPITIDAMILSKTTKTMGPNKFCRWLLDNDFAFRNGQGKIIPMQDAVNRSILTSPNASTRPVR